MKTIRLCTTVIARFFLSFVFLAGAISKILHWHEVERSLLTTLCEWQSYLGFSDGLQECLTALIPFTPVLLLLATGFEFLGALSVLLGVREKWGATLLILFLIPSTILIHQFWFVEGSARELQLTHFLKNLAILGGLLMILLKEEEPDKISFSSKFG